MSLNSTLPSRPVLQKVYEQPATLAKVANSCLFNLIQVLLAKGVITKEDLPAIFRLNHEAVHDDNNVHMISTMLNNLHQLSEYEHALR